MRPFIFAKTLATIQNIEQVGESFILRKSMTPKHQLHTSSNRTNVVNLLQTHNHDQVFILTSIAGNQYTGEWNRNTKHGFGVAVTSTGEKYEGYWKNNKREGSGTLYLKRKGRFRKHYQGDFFQNKKHGMGMLFGENSK